MDGVLYLWESRVVVCEGKGPDVTRLGATETRGGGTLHTQTQHRERGRDEKAR